MTLENQYRWLLRAYPRAYRERRGEEMLGTLLDSAAPHQTRPSPGDVTDLLGGAARERLGLHAVPGFAAGLRIAGPPSLAWAAAWAIGVWVAGDRSAALTVVAAAWLLATVAYAVGRLAAAAVIAAWLVTAGGFAVTAISPPLVVDETITIYQYWQYTIPLVSGLIAALATATPRPVASRFRPGLERAGVGFAVALAASAAAFVDAAMQRVTLGPVHIPSPAWAPGWVVLPVAALAVGIVVAAVRHDTRWLWAGSIMLVPAALTSWGMLGGPYTWGLPDGFILLMVTPDSLAGLLGAGLAVAVLITAAGASAGTAAPVSRSRLAVIGTFSLDLAAALAAFRFAATGTNAADLTGWAPDMNTATPTALAAWAPGVCAAVLVIAAVANRFSPAWPARLLIVAGFVPLQVAWWSGVNGGLAPELYAALLPLLAVALVAPRSPATPRIAGAFLAAIAVLAAFGGPLVQGTSTFAAEYLSPAIAGIALVPTLWFAGRAVVTAPRGAASAAVAFAAAGYWVMVQGFEVTAGTLVAIAVGAALAILVAARFVRQYASRTTAAPPRQAA